MLYAVCVTVSLNFWLVCILTTNAFVGIYVTGNIDLAVQNYPMILLVGLVYVEFGSANEMFTRSICTSLD